MFICFAHFSLLPLSYDCAIHEHSLLLYLCNCSLMKSDRVKAKSFHKVCRLVQSMGEARLQWKTLTSTVLTFLLSQESCG